jgi:hypothetical protein
MGINTNDNDDNHNHNRSDDVVVVDDDDHDHDDSNIPDVRPLKYGSATPPPISVSHDFNGRSGVWVCENCSCKVLLEPYTKQWTCKRCKKTMYTMPKDDDCPLDTFCPCCCWDTILTRN